EELVRRELTLGRDDGELGLLSGAILTPFTLCRSSCLLGTVALELAEAGPSRGHGGSPSACELLDGTGNSAETPIRAGEGYPFPYLRRPSGPRVVPRFTGHATVSQNRSSTNMSTPSFAALGVPA